GAHYHQDDIKAKDPQSGTEDPQVEWTNPALFALSEWDVTDRLRFDAGLRWDRFTLDSNAPAFSKLNSTVQNAINNGSFSLDDLELDETDDAVTGGLGLVYSLTDQINLVSNVGYAFRAPNKSDMLNFGQFTYGFNVPSPNLDPEKSYTYELGLKSSSPNFSSAVTGFYTTVDDAIVSEESTFAGSDFVDVNGNGIKDSGEQVYKKKNSNDRLAVYGVELEGKWYLPSDWTEPLVQDNAFSTYGNFAWIYGEDKGVHEPMDRAYPTNALLGVRIENDRNPNERRWWAGIEAWMVRHFDRIPSSRLNSDPAFKQDPQDSSSFLLRSDGSVPGFTLFNLRGGVKLSHKVTLTLAVDNFTDKKYRVKDSRIDGPGINFVTGLEVVF
ncbi:MAG: TonB-dependent receptor, partial [Planctomycetota bacterium]